MERRTLISTVILEMGPILRSTTGSPVDGVLETKATRERKREPNNIRRGRGSIRLDALKL
jgi:hypothetical protein